MMFEYNYAREVVNGQYNINNIAALDGEGNPVSLARVMQSQFPTKGPKFCIRADGPEALLLFDVELGSAEKTQLDQIVADYKNGILP